MTRILQEKLRQVGRVMLLGATISFLHIAAVSAQTTTAPSEVNVSLSPVQEVNLSPMQKLGKMLDDMGIYFTSKYTGQFAANPSGGQRQGSAYAGDLTFGATFDLKKMAGISGASIHILFDDRSGASLSAQTINSDLAAQNIFGAGQTYQLAILTYEQKLFHGAVDINVGRTDIAFLTSPFYCDFETHGDCGRPYGMSKNVSSSVYPEAVWGGRILVFPTPNFYGKVGVYQPNPDLQPALSHGFDWGIRPADGLIAPMEIGYLHQVPGAVAADQYDIGYIISSAPFSAKFFNGVDPNFDNRGAIYIQAQKMVYQAEPNSPRGLYLFGMDFFTTSGSKQVARMQSSIGAVWQGPFANRPLDRIDFQANDYEFNKLFLNSLFEERLKAGGHGFPDTNQATFELNYAFQANRWLQLMPNFQYIINPDGMGGTTFPNANLPNAVVLGLQFSIDLPSMLGISSYPVTLAQDN
jgi:porin